MLNLGLCVEFPPDPKQVYINATSEPTNGPLKFAFDYVFPPGTEQALVYDAAAKPIVESVLEGFNGTVFAYGQTGSGKTFTMTGVVDDSRLKGITPRMIDTVFHTISTASDSMEFTVKVGYCEIYLEKIKDLLNPTKTNLKVHEDKNRGVFIADLTEEYVSDESEVTNLMRIGSANREVAFTLMNEGSSRSHSLFILTITQNNTIDFSAKTGKLYLVDLAGSEKVGKTGAEGKRLDEAKNINKSLSTLGQVINALTDGKSSHVPYRDSKLTRVLQDSLGGNSKTSLIITASPSSFNEPETISTLRFGMRAKAIKNKPTVNKEYTVAELKLLLSKAEMELGKKVLRIQLLEAAVLEAGAKVPSDESMEILEDVERSTERSDIYVQSGEIEELQQEVETLKNRLSTECDRSITVQSRLTDTERRVTDLLSQRDKMQTEINRMLDTIRSLEDEKSLVDDQLSKVSKLYTDSIGKITTLTVEKEQNDGKIAALEGKIAVLEKESTGIFVVNAQNSEFERQIEDLRGKLDAWDRGISHIVGICSDSNVLDVINRLKNDGLTDYMGIKQILEHEQTKNYRLIAEIHQNNENFEAVLTEKAVEFAEIIEKSVSNAVFEAKKSFEAEKSKLICDLEYEKINYRNLSAQKSEEESVLRKKITNLERNIEEFAHFHAKPVISNSESALEPMRSSISEDNLIEGKQPISAEELLELERHQRFLSRVGGTKIKKMIKGGKAQKLRVMGMFSPFTSLAKTGKEGKRGEKVDGEEGEEKKGCGRSLFRVD